MPLKKLSGPGIAIAFFTCCIYVSFGCLAQAGSTAKFVKNNDHYQLPKAKLAFAGGGVETITKENEQTGEKVMTIVSRNPTPVKIDGTAIYKQGEVTQGVVFNGHFKNIITYLFSTLKTELKMLDDGNYSLRFDNIVIDSKGNVAFFDYNGPEKIVEKGGNRSMGENNITAINKKFIEAVAACPTFKPAQKNNADVALLVQPNSDEKQFRLNGHKLFIFASGKWVEL